MKRLILFVVAVPLWCPQYQYPAYVDGKYEQTCVDELHTLTEREWQELMARLKALELSKPTLPSDVVATPAANGYPPEKKP